MTIEDDIVFLERVPTLAMLGREALRILAIGSESRYVHDGAVLFREGEEADSAFVVQEGSFELGIAGSRQVPQLAGPGALLGEFALIAETTRPMTAVAREPSTVVRITRQLFLKMLDGYPDAAVKLRDTLARRLDQSSREIFSVRNALNGGQSR
jgi:CRP-like cAMP-binding protein